MLTYECDRRNALARIVFAVCLLLAAAGWAQANTSSGPEKLKARLQNGSLPFGQTRDAGVPDPSGRAAAPAASSVLPQFAFGGGWYSAIYFTNLTNSPVSFPVNFVSDTGTPLTVPSLGGSTTQVNLAANGTALIEAPNAGSLVQGYAAFTPPSGVFGYGVFRGSVPGQQDQEAVVPLSDAGATSSTLTWDDTKFVTSVAIVNPGATATTVAVALYDESGNAIGTSSVSLPPYGKMAATLRSLPGLAGMAGKRGSAQFSVPAGSVAVLGLRFNGLAFTSIPTSTSNSGSVAKPSVLPQLAFGGGWYSALYFTNLTGAAISFPVNFVSDAGTPLTVPQFGGSIALVNLPAHGTAIVEAPNVGSLVQGYAAFTLPKGVFGYGVFRGSVPGQQDQEAVVPFSDAGATSNTLTWDDTGLVTSVAVVNPSASTATVAVTLYDENGSTIGNSSIFLLPKSKTATTLRTLPGLSGMAGKRGSAKFSASAGSVAVLGLRFDGLAFTSVPTTDASGNAVAQRALAQTGLAVGMASIVLQSQVNMLLQIIGPTGCTVLDGGGSVRSTGSNAAAVYYDSYCTRPYIVTNPGTTVTESENGVAIVETATYYGLNGAVIGSLALNESAKFDNSGTVSLYGLGVFTPAAGAKIPVQLGLWCALAETANTCAGGLAQNFPALGLAIGAVTRLTLAVPAAGGAVTFSGSGAAVTGPIGSLTLTNPSPTSLVIQGGADYSAPVARGGAAAFALFPPTPTAWTLTDSAHDQQFEISVIDNATRNLTLTIKQISSGVTLATGAVDQSGTGTITYSDGSTVAITNWTLAD